MTAKILRSAKGRHAAIAVGVTAALTGGLRAWHHLPSQGPWAEHVHTVAISDTDMSPQAQQQAGAYFQGRNGLADNGKDNGPRVKKVTWEEDRRG